MQQINSFSVDEVSVYETDVCNYLHPNSSLTVLARLSGRRTRPSFPFPERRQGTLMQLTQEKCFAGPVLHLLAKSRKVCVEHKMSVLRGRTRGDSSAMKLLTSKVVYNRMNNADIRNYLCTTKNFAQYPRFLARHIPMDLRSVYSSAPTRLELLADRLRRIHRHMDQVVVDSHRTCPRCSIEVTI